jgi:histidine triad (HIT) family protein
MDKNCIFCKIVAGDIPCVRILEDEHALAFMDIGPLAEGHVLLVPRKHWKTIDEMAPEEAAALLKHLPPLVKAVQVATGCQGVNLLQNNGKAAHQEVPHVHFHIIPRNEGDAFHFNWPARKYESGRMEALQKRIREAL